MSETVEDAFDKAPASADRTALIAAYNSVLAAIDTAVGNARIGSTSGEQLKSEVVDQSETTAANLGA